MNQIDSGLITLLLADSHPPSTPSVPTPGPCWAFSVSGTAYKVESSPSILGDSRPPTAREASELLGTAGAILSYCLALPTSSDFVERVDRQNAAILIGKAYASVELALSVLGFGGSASASSVNPPST